MTKFRGVGRAVKGFLALILAAVVEYGVTEILKSQERLGHDIGWVGRLMLAVPAQVWTLIGFAAIVALYVSWPSIAARSALEAEASGSPPDLSTQRPRITTAPTPCPGKLTVFVTGERGMPLDQAMVSAVSEETRAPIPEQILLTADDGTVSFEAVAARSYTILAAHPAYPGVKLENVDGGTGVLRIRLAAREQIASLIISHAIGYLPGLDAHRFNVHDDPTGNHYVYVDGLSDEQGPANPAHFRIKQTLTLQNLTEPVVHVRFLFIAGQVSLLNYWWATPQEKIAARHTQQAPKGTPRTAVNELMTTQQKELQQSEIERLQATIESLTRQNADAARRVGELERMLEQPRFVMRLLRLTMNSPDGMTIPPYTTIVAWIELRNEGARSAATSWQMRLTLAGEQISSPAFTPAGRGNRQHIREAFMVTWHPGGLGVVHEFKEWLPEEGMVVKTRAPIPRDGDPISGHVVCMFRNLHGATLATLRSVTVGCVDEKTQNWHEVGLPDGYDPVFGKVELINPHDG
jgi:hypothetical protein